MNATTDPFPEYDRLKNVAEHCTRLQDDYLSEEDYAELYGIEGIPIMLFPVGGDGASLVGMLDIHKQILETAREEDSMELLEHRELIQYEQIVERGMKWLDEIHHSLVYQNIHFQIQLNVFQSNNAQQIYFPGTRIHDVPPVNIRFRFDPNWSGVEFLKKKKMFDEECTKYFLLIDAYKFTYDASRIANAIQLSSREDHPFHEFFLAPRYIQIFRAYLIEVIAIWLDYNHDYWSVISP